MKRKEIGLFFIFVVILSAGQAFSATIGLRAVDSNLLNVDGNIAVNVGDFFEVELFINGLPTDLADLDAGGIVAMGLNIDWDPLVALDPDDIVISDFYSTGAFTYTPGPPVPDSIEIYMEAKSASAIFDDHAIANLTLQCVGEGFTTLIPDFALPIPFNIALEDGFLDEKVIFEGVGITQAVPIPPALLLFGSGIIGMLGLRRKFNK